VYPTVLYELRDVIGDLMSLAAQHLKLGGRLVFWLPLIGEVPYEERIPKHPLLKLISNCEQEFNQWTRSLLTYVRIDTPEAELGLQESRKEVKEKRRPEFRDMVHASTRDVINLR
jgi:tRNA G10  N-methylase Trm11